MHTSQTTIILLLTALTGACKAAPGDDSGSATGSSETTPTTGSESGVTDSVDTSEGGGTEPTGDETGDVVFAGACPLAERVGGFELLLEADYTAFSGAVADGVVPITVLEPVGEGDGCMMLRRNNPFCDPPCQPSTTCDFDGACIPYPQNHDVGLIEITGLVESVEVAPVKPTYDYFKTDLMHPAFLPGAAVDLRAAGGDYPAFDLHGEGVAMIEPTSAMLALANDQPLKIDWTPADGAAKVRIELSIDQHGNTPVRLVCLAEDTGSLTIPAALVSQLVGFGISGYPSVQYYRETVDSLALEPGCVEFAVRSHRQTGLMVAGHIPCNKPTDCPDGKVCDIKIQTCK